MLGDEIDDYKKLRKTLDELCDTLSLYNASEETIFDSKLIVSELIGNILKHTNGFAKFEKIISNDGIELVIHSSVYYQPPEKNDSSCSQVFSENGRGLYIVDKLCEKRSCDSDGTIHVLVKMIKKN